MEPMIISIKGTLPPDTMDLLKEVVVNAWFEGISFTLWSKDGISYTLRQNRKGIGLPLGRAERFYFQHNSTELDVAFRRSDLEKAAERLRAHRRPRRIE
tara:strand:+ start:7396 stop:7692 length:297 start_codon:yes stop_codon:yes gene_type:complete